MPRPSFAVRRLVYDLDTSLLVRPGVLLLVHVLAALLLPPLEVAVTARSAALRDLAAWIALEPGTAQVLMATVAGSMMTVVSVVYSILLVALSLASIQFSTRILAGFMRDRVSQTVLGLFVGTFAYCLGLIRAIHSDPPVVPTLSVLAGLGLTMVSLASLVMFIHHIVRSIQANVLVNRIATEAEHVISDVFRAGTDPRAEGCPHLPHAITSDRSGYVQMVDTDGLLRHAPGHTLAVLRPMGSFVPAGGQLLASDRPISPELAREIVACIEIGPERTMQDDVEFGFRQIVDIALKALSPAVNDPSTAATCIDHLGRLLIQVARRPAPQTWFSGSSGGALFVCNTSFGDLLDLSVEQIRQYGRADMATGLRLLRILREVLPFVPDAPDRARIARQGAAVIRSAELAFSPEDCEEIRHRYAQLQEALGGAQTT